MDCIELRMMDSIIVPERTNPIGIFVILYG